MAFVAVARADEIAVGHGAFIERDGLPVAVFNAGGGRFYARAGSRAAPSCVRGTASTSTWSPVAATSTRISPSPCTLYG
jgi:hypothetical protein